MENNKTEKTKNSARQEAYDWITCVVSALVCAILIFVFVGRIIGVSGDSMKNTLLDGERIVISNLFYKPKQGDIVVLNKYSFLDEPIVKRVIAVEGQTVDIDFDTGEVRVDGELLHEDYIAAATHRFYDVTFPQTVPEGCVFVMGDNRNASNDSRNSELGMVDRRCIMGKAYMILLPISKLRFLG
jgi:signal peptidase I